MLYSFSLFLSNCGFDKRKIQFMHFSLQRALLHCSFQTSVEPLKDYSARKSISLQSGSLSAGLFRPVSCYKTNLIVMEATAVNKQKQYNMFLFRCHWFRASMLRWLRRLLFIAAVRQEHNCDILLANLQRTHVCVSVCVLRCCNESPVPVTGLRWWVICQRCER